MEWKIYYDNIVNKDDTLKVTGYEKTLFTRRYLSFEGNRFVDNHPLNGSGLQEAASASAIE